MFCTIIYETYAMRKYLRLFILNGNETEMNYALKLLLQLCFDKRVAKDVLADEKLLQFIQELNETSQSAKGILWILNDDISNQKRVMKSVEESKDDDKHIMISYNSKSRELCLNIKAALEELGHKVWIDIESIYGSSLEAMAEAIESSKCVLVCVTEKYKESNFCRLEAEYLVQQKKPYVPLLMQKGYKPDGWLGIILGSRIFIDFTKLEFNKAMIDLKRNLSLVLHKDNHKVVSTDHQTVSKEPVEIVSNLLNKHLNSSKKQEERNWNHQEVEQWLKYRKDQISISL